MRSVIILICLYCAATYRCNGQETKVYELKYENRLCNATITFVKGGNFIYERGCEESSHVCFGVWRKNGNKIKLEPLDNKNINLIRYFESPPSKDSFSNIKVFDMYGKDMTNKMKYIMLDTNHKEIAATNNWAEAAQHSRFIRLATLKNVFAVSIDIQNSKPVNNIIQLNIPEYYIYNENSVWEIPDELDYTVEYNCLKGVKAQNYYCPRNPVRATK